MHNTIDDKLTLNGGNSPTMSFDWYIDTSFAVHPNFKGHSRMVMNICGRKGTLIMGSEKQKINSNGSTTSKLVATHQFLLKVLWTKFFLEVQDIMINKNVV